MAGKKEPANPCSSAATDVDQPDIKGIPIVPALAAGVKTAMIPFEAKGKLEIPRFLRAPTWLFGADYSALSSDAKILYIAMLDRLSLSARNGWRDDSGALYIFYTIADVQRLLDCGHTKASAALRELCQHGLILRAKQGQGRPAIVYLYQPATATRHPPKVDTVMPTTASAVAPTDASTKLPASTPPPLPSISPQSNSLLSAFFSQ